jgi:FAD/FMN-containing dehydrogenase
VPHRIRGEVLRRADAGYESARREAVRNGLVPDRFPELIVRAEGEADVVAAVGLAREQAMRIGIRSGGHSWSASFLRDGGMLLDLSRMTDARIDPKARTAAVQPGLTGSELSRRLRQHGLFFPTGHCTNVGLGGFLLQGGFGWDSRALGPACMSVSGIEVVTADGELLSADETRNPELYWAARGAGPGFFGVVTRFHLSLHEHPSVIRVSTYIYPAEVLEELLSWAREIQPQVSRRMELMVFLRRDLPGVEGPGLVVMGPVLADSEEEAAEAAAVLETCPVIDKAVTRHSDVSTEIDEMLAGSAEMLYPVGPRYASDNMWTNAGPEELMPGMRRIAEGLPAAPSHMMWMLWGPPPARPDMAFSCEAELYIALYSVWNDPAADEVHEAWVADNMRELEHLSEGIQLADENLGRRPFRFLAEQNLDRLESVRARWDPDGLFHSYMGLPESTS